MLEKELTRFATKIFQTTYITFFLSVKEPKKKIIMEFKKIRPPPFEGTTNPDEVECWVEEMKKSLL